MLYFYYHFLGRNKYINLFYKKPTLFLFPAKSLNLYKTEIDEIFRCDQIREIDTQTIKVESIESVDLMERAAGQLLKWHMSSFDRSRRIIILADRETMGAMALLLPDCFMKTASSGSLVCKFTENTSRDWKINRQRLENETPRNKYHRYC